MGMNYPDCKVKYCYVLKYKSNSYCFLEKKNIDSEKCEILFIWSVYTSENNFSFLNIKWDIDNYLK